MTTEDHSTKSDMVKDIIIGMSDGLTVPFALTAGLSGVIGMLLILIIFYPYVSFDLS